MSFQKPHIALAGATGNLDLVILDTLLSAGYTVTALTRHTSPSISKLPSHPNLTAHPVDFTSVTSLTTALLSTSTKASVVISALATLPIGAQNPLIDACGAAGLNPLARDLPVCAPKAATQRYLAQKCAENPECGFSWTGIANGLFLDWSATLYNGSDVQCNVTLLMDVARAVLGVIENLDSEDIRNRVVYVDSAVVSQRRLIGYVQEMDDGGPDVEGAMLGFCIVGSWDPEYGCDFLGRLDNELLGMKEMSEKGLKGFIS
ncbi:hypothetical protein BJX66DRAFT_326678 [Aspergillus keveii]|uniref:NAD(P)-binding domain-containing protein n=1 Tax=Aspergillus keveii TaxID=714993 RepID=A0ABR4G0S9_9EURO